MKIYANFEKYERDVAQSEFIGHPYWHSDISHFISVIIHTKFILKLTCILLILLFILWLNGTCPTHMQKKSNWTKTKKEGTRNTQIHWQEHQVWTLQEHHLGSHLPEAPCFPETICIQQIILSTTFDPKKCSTIYCKHNFLSSWGHTENMGDGHANTFCVWTLIHDLYTLRASYIFTGS